MMLSTFKLQMSINKIGCFCIFDIFYNSIRPIYYNLVLHFQVITFKIENMNCLPQTIFKELITYFDHVHKV